MQSRPWSQSLVSLPVIDMNFLNERCGSVRRWAVYERPYRSHLRKNVDQRYTRRGFQGSTISRHNSGVAIIGIFCIRVGMCTCFQTDSIYYSRRFCTWSFCSEPPILIGRVWTRSGVHKRSSCQIYNFQFQPNSSTIFAFEVKSRSYLRLKMKLD